MPETELKLFRRCVEFQPRTEIRKVPRGTRGLYALLRWRPRLLRYDVVYVGLSRTGVRARLDAHARVKGDLWTHFSLFEVFDNISGEQNQELEGLLRHIYRSDSKANRLNMQKGFKKLQRVRLKRLDDWPRG